MNVAAIQAQVNQLIGGGTTPTTAAPTTAGVSSGVTVDVLNATGRTGLAAQLQQALTARGYTAGSARSDDRHLTHTLVDYPPGQQAVATALAGLVGSTDVVVDPMLPAGHLRVVEGTDLTMPSAAPPSAAAPSSGPSAGAAAGSSPAALNPLASGGIPCVK